MKKILWMYWVGTILMFGCKPELNNVRMTDQAADIYPDYQDVTVPVNIAPLHFEVNDDGVNDWALQIISMNDTTIKKADGNYFEFDEDKWKKLLADNQGKSIELILCKKTGDGWEAYKPFHWRVEEEIDAYLAYRLIPPGYSLWKEMGIYQRCLETFEETAIYKNEQGMGNCVNCHSFSNRNPDRMLFHFRSELAATYIIKDGKKEKLNTKTDNTISPLVYPYWHPSGNSVAFSVNKTFQFLHSKDPNRIEVCDEASDVVIYNVGKREIVTSPLLSSEQRYETFPAFSPDGKSLYYCSAQAVESMPRQYQDVKYSLCRIDFDEDTYSFGTQVDTLYNAAIEGRSVSFPRVSPDGRYLVFTLSDYGNFSIWHKDADLYAVDLQTGITRPLDALNSDDVESYHSWSGNSRWIVFSSRREDGLYTKPYFSYVDKDGNFHKPFLMPQQNPKDYYKAQMNAYNIPEFINGKVDAEGWEIAEFAKNTDAEQVK